MMFLVRACAILAASRCRYEFQDGRSLQTALEGVEEVQHTMDINGLHECIRLHILHALLFCAR